MSHKVEVFNLGVSSRWRFVYHKDHAGGGCTLKSEDRRPNPAEVPYATLIAPNRPCVVNHVSWDGDPECMLRIRFKQLGAHVLAGITPRCYCCGVSAPCEPPSVPICINNNTTFVGCTVGADEKQLVQLQTSLKSKTRRAKKPRGRAKSGKKARKR
jgi:hypothetical protein